MGLLSTDNMLVVGYEVLSSIALELGFLVSCFVVIWLHRKKNIQSGKAGPKVAAKHALSSTSGAKDIWRAAKAPVRRRATQDKPQEMDIKNPTKRGLTDRNWIARAVRQLSRTDVQGAMTLFRQAVTAGLDCKSPLARTDEILMDLVAAAVRAGQPQLAVQFFRHLNENNVGVPMSVLASATKLCTSRQFYRECLQAFDAANGQDLQVEDRTIWSCLLFCSVETRTFNRCALFWSRMHESGTPTRKDYGNMMRYALNEGDWKLALSLVKEMVERNVEVDGVMYNTALATCVAENRTTEARELLKEMDTLASVADVITYNILAKGYAKLGLLDECFELYEQMRERGIQPSQVTYGILLDCCINVRQIDKAVEVFELMTKEKCPMNTVLYTILIKGFARAEQVDQAMKVYERMIADTTIGVTPDLITFSVLIKANCDAGRLRDAIRLFDTMNERNFAPDEVIFNNLLSGCVQENDHQRGKRLFDDMIKAGLRPSNATFSIMIRLYATCRMFHEAVEILLNEPPKHRVLAEPRLYLQLAQACLREREGLSALEVCKAMALRTTPSPPMVSSLLAMSGKLNMLGTGVDIIKVFLTSGVKINSQDLQDFKAIAVRKKKMQVIEQIDVALSAL